MNGERKKQGVCQHMLVLLMFLAAWSPWKHLGGILEHLGIMWGEFKSIGGLQIGKFAELDLA
eukprot:2571272-Karenia_brevis.AAC.1